MPRSRRGGKRTGTPGKAHAQRTDLNRGPLPVQTVPSAHYGDAVTAARAQQALPMAPPPGPGAAPTPAPGGGPQAAPAPPGPAGAPPGFLGDMHRPSARPGEPVTAGMAIGPGAGPEALAMPMGASPVDAELRALYLRFPNEDLRSVLEDMAAGRDF